MVVFHTKSTNDQIAYMCKYMYISSVARQWFETPWIIVSNSMWNILFKFMLLPLGPQ